METNAVCNASIIMPEGILQGRTVIFEGAKIKEIAPDGKITFGTEEAIDADGNLLAPGYIDLHMHGACNKLSDRSANELEKFTLDVYGHVIEKMKRESASRMETFIQNIKN